MTLNAIIIIIFLCLIMLIAIFYRNSTLDRLELLPGESLLFEEKGVKVEQAGAPSTAVFIGCIVRVTNARIIIAQKMLFRERYALRHVIIYGGGEDAADLKNILSRGYIEMKVDRASIKLEQSGSGVRVTIPVPDTALTRGQYITWQSSLTGDYYRLK